MDRSVIGKWSYTDLLFLAVLVAAVAFAVRSVLRTIGDRRSEAAGGVAIVLVVVAVVARVVFKMSASDSVQYAILVMMCAIALLGALLWLNRRTSRWQGTGVAAYFAQFGPGVVLSLFLFFLPTSLGTGAGKDRGASSAAMVPFISFMSISALLPAIGFIQRLRPAVVGDRIPQRPSRNAQIGALAIAALFAVSGISAIARGFVWYGANRLGIAALIASGLLLIRVRVPAYVRTVVGGLLLAVIGGTFFKQVHEQVHAAVHPLRASTANAFYGAAAVFVLLGVAAAVSALQVRRRDRLSDSVVRDLAAEAHGERYVVADLRLRSGDEEREVGIINRRYLDRFTCRRKLDAREVVGAHVAARNP